MKSFIKNRKRLIRLGEYLGVICLLVSGLISNVYYPHSTSTEIGCLDTITVDRKSHIDKYKTTYYYVYIFHINNKECATFVGKVNYDYLIGKVVVLKHYTDPFFPDGYEIYEIAYNNKVVFSTDKFKPLFFKWLTLFLLSLMFCIWLLILRFKDTKTNPQTVTSRVEDYFFDNWSIAEKNGNCTLSYISKLDSSLHKIKITNDEFLLAKQKKMLFEEFSSKYQLF